MSPDLARRLSLASDDLAVVIQRVEDEINSHHLGVEAWVADGLQVDAVIWQLGFGHLKHHWGLLVRRPGQPPVRLGHANRRVRLAAVPVLPAVLEAVVAAAEQMADDLEGATKMLTEALALSQISQSPGPQPRGATIARSSALRDSRTEKGPQRGS